MDPLRSAHIGGRPSGRLLRGARPGTVRAHPFGSPSRKPSAGSPSGRRMAPRSAASATARSRPRCTTRAARSQLHRPHRSQHGCRAAPVHQGRVGCLPRVRHPGARLPEAARRRVRPRQAAGLQLQASRVPPLVRRAAHVSDRGAPGGPRHPTCSGATVGVVAADTAAFAAGRAARTGHAGAAGGAAHGHAPSVGFRRAQGRRKATAAPSR